MRLRTPALPLAGNGVDFIDGIFLFNSTTTASSNTCHNLTAAGGTGTTPAALVVGIGITSALAKANAAIQDTIFNLANTDATAATVVTGTQFNGATGNVVEGNLIHGLTAASNSASAQVNGIRVAGDTTNDRNDMIAIGTDAVLGFFNSADVANLAVDRIPTTRIIDGTGVATGGVVPRIHLRKNAVSYFSSVDSLMSGTSQNGT